MIALTLAILLAAAGLGHAYGHRLQSRGLTVDSAFRSGPRAWILLGSLLGVAGALFFLFKYTAWLSPEVSGFLQAFVWAYLKGSLAFLGGMAVPLSMGRPAPERGMTVAIAVVAIGAIQRVEGWVFAPVHAGMHEERRAADGSILQTQDTSCTAAALANLLPRFGRHGSEADCARALGTTRFGTTNSQVMRGVRAFGLYGYYVTAGPDTLRRIDRPALLTVWSSGGARHSVALVGAKGTVFEIVDPLSGRGTISGRVLEQRLADSRAIVLLAEPIPDGDALSWLLRSRPLPTTSRGR